MLRLVCTGKVQRRGLYMRGKGAPLEVVGVGGGSLSVSVFMCE